MNSPAVFGGCPVSALGGPAGANLNSSTGNLLEPTSLTNVNSSSQHNTIYGHRRFLPRLPNGSGRSNAHHPYGAMFYPEFEYRPPPPSYTASMQEYRLRMLLYERANGLNSNNNLDINSNLNTPVATANNSINNNSTTNNTSSTNSTNHVQTSTTTTTNTFSGLLSGLGSFVSNSFSGGNNQRTLSPPPSYRPSTGASTLAGK